MPHATRARLAIIPLPGLCVRTLNATGQARVMISPRSVHVRAGRGLRLEGRGPPDILPNTILAGMYDHDQLPSTPCVECPTGRFQSQTGTTECSLCAAGLYQTTVKASECAKCPAGKTTNVSRTFEQVPSTIL